MALAARIVGEYDKLTYLPQHGLLALAARTALEPVVNKIIARVDAGERHTAAVIIREIESERKVMAEAKQSPRRRNPDPAFPG